MARAVTLQWSRAYAADPDRAYDEVMGCDLARLFAHRFGPLPAIDRVEDQDGAWSAVGQTRTIHLADGAQMTEQLVAVEPKRWFGYELTNPTGPLGTLVSTIDGLWAFTPVAGGGGTVTWRWRLHPRSTLALPALAVLGVFWRGYARRAFRDLDDVLGPA